MSEAKLKVQLESNPKGVGEKYFSHGARPARTERVRSGGNGKTVGFPAGEIAKRPTQKHLKKDTVLVLDNIRSVFNVGSIFRTGDGSGVSKIYLVGVTPDPVDRFGRERKDLAKVALGSEKRIPWEHAEDLKTILKKLKKDGFQILALEQSDKSIDYKKFKPKFPLAVVLGEEVRGIDQRVLDECDTIIEIPMMGEKESLNVSVATGVALFRILNV
jgi:23S rRNA (guanosine2251-2'-O)-methyltransferase